MENLNIALIGCGMIGREHIERIQNRIRNAKVGKFVRMGENLVLHQRVDLLDGAVLADVDGVLHENALKAYGQQTKTNR